MTLQRFIGSITCVAVLGVLGMSASFWPEGPTLGTFARILDSLAFHLAALTLVLSLLLMILGARRLGGVLAFLVCVQGAALISVLWSNSDTLADPSGQNRENGLRVLWFNMLQHNQETDTRLVQSIVNSGADVAVIGEALPLLHSHGDLRETYPHQLGCVDRKCSLLVLSKLPLVQQDTFLRNTTRPQRMAKVVVEINKGKEFTLLAAHLAKPWYFGYIEHELWHLEDIVTGVSGPLVVLGDFNSAPWGQLLQGIYGSTGLRAVGKTIATWPAFARSFGVPIDQFLVKNGAQVARIEAWGDDLGSNHRGLIADVIWR